MEKKSHNKTKFEQNLSENSAKQNEVKGRHLPKEINNTHKYQQEKIRAHPKQMKGEKSTPQQQNSRNQQLGLIDNSQHQCSVLPNKRT